MSVEEFDIARQNADEIMFQRARESAEDVNYSPPEYYQAEIMKILHEEMKGFDFSENVQR